MVPRVEPEQRQTIEGRSLVLALSQPCFLKAVVAGLRDDEVVEDADAEAPGGPGELIVNGAVGADAGKTSRG